MQAHQHAANADDYLARGLLIPAAEEHYKAAEAFQACVDASNDENVRFCLLLDLSLNEGSLLPCILPGTHVRSSYMGITVFHFPITHSDEAYATNAAQ